jgi:hypothetical protein
MVLVGGFVVALLLAASGMVRGAGALEAGPQVVRVILQGGAFDPATLRLAPGRYLFMVTNADVDGPVDFRLTRHDDGRNEDRAVRGARLGHAVKRGETSSTPVLDLQAGSYAYGSPLGGVTGGALRVE